jgi:hypothetical protein
LEARNIKNQNLERLSQLDYVAILFVPRDPATARIYSNQFDQLQFPLAYERWVVELDETNPICGHLGIVEAPVLVICYRGMLLAMVEECEQTACDWLVSFSRNQVSRF